MKKFSNESIQDLFKISDLKVSPDGKHIVYTASRTDLAADKKLPSIWLIDLETEKEIRLTSGTKDGAPFWLDNDRVLFLSARGGDHSKETKVYCIDINGGEACEYMTVPIPGAQISPLNDDLFLVRAATDANKEPEKRNQLWMYCTEYPFRREGFGYTSKLRRSIFLFNKKTGELKQLTPPLMFAVPPALSDDIMTDEKGFFYCGWEYDDRCDCLNAIYRYDWESGENRKLCSFKGMLFSMTMRDGRVWFVYASMDDSDTTGSFPICSISEKGDLRYEARPGWECYGVGSSDGRWLITRVVNARFELMEWKGGLELEPVPTGSIQPHRPFPIGEDCVFLGHEPDLADEIYMIRKGELRQLTHHNDEFYKEYELSLSEPINAVYQGHEVCGWVMKPAGYEPGKKYPAILSIHGGPHAFYFPAFEADFQRWTAEGYFVFYCNPRGSTSYGNDFLHISGDFMQPPYEDIMAFTDEVIAKYPDIDADRLAVTGASYGGVMTNWIIGHTDRFKAAVSRASISNWISFLGTADLREYFTILFGADYNTDVNRVWSLSPLAYVDKVKTPTLFIQQDQDYRTPMEQAEQMFCALNLRGVPTKLLINFNGSHQKRSPKQVAHDNDAILEWLRIYVK